MDENALLTAFLMLLCLMYLDKKVCRVVQTILGLFLLTAVRILCVCLLLKKWILRFRKCLLIHIYTNMYTIFFLYKIQKSVVLVVIKRHLVACNLSSELNKYS